MLAEGAAAGFCILLKSPSNLAKKDPTDHVIQNHGCIEEWYKYGNLPIHHYKHAHYLM